MVKPAGKRLSPKSSHRIQWFNPRSRHSKKQDSTQRSRDSQPLSSTFSYVTVSLTTLVVRSSWPVGPGAQTSQLENLMVSAFSQTGTSAKKTPSGPAGSTQPLVLLRAWTAWRALLSMITTGRAILSIHQCGLKTPDSTISKTSVWEHSQVCTVDGCAKCHSRCSKCSMSSASDSSLMKNTLPLQMVLSQVGHSKRWRIQLIAKTLQELKETNLSPLASLMLSLRHGP